MTTQASGRSTPLPGIPQTIIKGTYQIVSAYRETDQSFLFKGRHLARQRDVVIKILKEHYANRPEFRERYIQEMEATQKLPENPNLIVVYDVDYVSNRYCVITEFFPSVSLDELVHRRQTLPLAMLLRVLEQVACVIGFAHREGLPHRHLKLDDILVNPDDHHIRATHFSFPRAVVSSILTGRNLSSSIGSDILELGVLLYRLVCFDYPFRDRTEIPEIVADRLQAQLQRSYPELPPHQVRTVTTLFIRSTTRDMSRRLARYEEFIEEVRRVMESCPRLQEKKKSDQAREKRELLLTAYDTVAALRGDYKRPPSAEGLPDAAVDAPDVRALVAPPTPAERGATDENQGLLVWSRDDEGPISFESPLMTALLILTIVTLLLGIVYRLFA